ncbi:MAG TPA: PTS sugar transporter subunit IIA [Opitutaceae bacterium]|nr:PTS sugar transporter subunit IIA [Opitutaceae bacterium]
MPVRLTQLLHPSRVLLNVQQTKRTAAINEVARLLEGHPDITDYPHFYNELLARERLDPTCIGNEVALPHARTDHAQAIVLAIGRCPSGVYFENCQQTVRLIFVVATPKSQPGDYLALVGALCRVLKAPETRDALMKAQTPEEFIQPLVDAEARLFGKA